MGDVVNFGSVDEAEKLRRSLGAYYLSTNPGYRYYRYQQKQIIPALEAVERGEILRLAIWMPPGHSKSDIATRTFGPWFMGRHPDQNVMVTSYAADLAADDFGARIKARMNGDVHMAIFPESRLTKDSRAKTHFNTLGGGTFYAVGFGGGITGKRLNLLIMDDLIKNSEDAQSEAVQVGLFDFYKRVAKDRMRPKGRMVMCCHRWEARDVYERIIEFDGTVDKGGAWTVLKIPAENPPGSGHYLWAEYYGKKYYEDFKRDEDTWWPKFMQEPNASKNFWFKEEWLQFYDGRIPPPRYNNYMIIDPSGKPSKHSDWTAIHVWAAGQDQKLFLADWVLDKFDPGDRLSCIMRLVRKWQPRQVIYEEYGLVNDVYYITEKMRQANMEERFYPTPVGKKGPRHNLSKNERIKGIIPFFREGRIFLPRKLVYVQQCTGKSVDLVDRFVHGEYTQYKGDGTVPHDDDLDAMSRLLEPELVIHYHENPDKDEDSEKEDFTNYGWESRY